MLEDKEHSFFPDTPDNNLRDLILADGAQANKFENVYRVSIDGQINRDAFRASIEESGKSCTCNRDLRIAQQQRVIDIGDYSVSFYQDYKDIIRLYRRLKKYHPNPVIMQGDIVPDHGLSILTKNSKTRKNVCRNSHIDLWKFSNADLIPFFKKYEGK